MYYWLEYTKLIYMFILFINPYDVVYTNIDIYIYIYIFIYYIYILYIYIYNK